MLIDTHCHLDFPDFDADREAVLENAKRAGVEVIINVASSMKGSRDAVRLAASYGCVFASVGIHPHDAREADSCALAEIEKLASEAKVVAVGEVGLDYYRNLSAPAAQEKVFRAFIEMAKRKHLSLIVHSRDAQDETLGILREHGTAGLPFVVHCFSGGLDFLRRCLDLGAFVSFTCNLTYKKSEALREACRFVPRDRFFLETDAPYLAPEGKRGRRNEPAYLVGLAREVAVVKEMAFDEVCSATTNSALDFFRIDGLNVRKAS